MTDWYVRWLEELLERERCERVREHTRLRRDLHKEGGSVAALSQQVGELQLLVAALIEVLKEKGAFDPAALAEAVERIDLEDGVRDRRVTAPDPIPSADPPRRTRRR
jgi:hypothetical protein